MFLIRDVMHCKPGMVKPMVEKFQAVSKLMRGMGMPGFRVVTDVSGAPFWTVEAEIEAASLDEFEKMVAKVMSDEQAGKIMEGYHDLVDHGRREIFKLEG
jgi:hypothetical protein